MKISKLNCVACGAPLDVTNDMDVLSCSACGSKLLVERSEAGLTLGLIEKLTQKVEDLGNKTEAVLQESAYATKIELQRVQVNQSINTEEIKLNSIRQEIRNLSRKTPLLPVEVEQLELLYQVECQSLQRIRKLNLELAKTEPGWQERLSVYQSDLARLDQIINIMTAYAGGGAAVKKTLDELLLEKKDCERNLFDLESRLLKNQLKSLRYASTFSLTLAEIEALNADLDADLQFLNAGAPSPVKQELIKVIQAKKAEAGKILPRRRVEVETGPLASLDLQAPFPEEPWALAPMIEQTEADYSRVNEISESAEKKAVLQEIFLLVGLLKKRQALNLPARKVKAEKRKRFIKFFLIGFFVVLAVILAVLFFAGKLNPFLASLSIFPGFGKDGQSYRPSGNRYEENQLALFEISAQRTYFHEEADIHSEETDELKQGDLVYDLGMAEEDADWFFTRHFLKDQSGYLYQEWLSPVTARSLPGEALPATGEILFEEEFERNVQDWSTGSFTEDGQERDFSIAQGAYQMNLYSANPGYAFSTITLSGLPPAYVLSSRMDLPASDARSGAGLIFNFVNEDHFDYFLLTPEGFAVIGCRRNGSSYTLYQTQETPNSHYSLLKNEPNKLSVLIDHAADSGTTLTQFAVNDQAIFSLQYERPSDNSSTFGFMAWTAENEGSITARFDDLSIRAVD